MNYTFDPYELNIHEKDICSFDEFSEAVDAGLLDDLSSKIQEKDLFDKRAFESFSFSEKLLVSYVNEFIWCRYLNGYKFIVDVIKCEMMYFDEKNNKISKKKFHQDLYSYIFMLLPIAN